VPQQVQLILHVALRIDFTIEENGVQKKAH